MISRIINLGQGRGYQPKPKADNPYRDLDYYDLDITKPNLILFYYILNEFFLSRFDIRCFKSLCQPFMFLRFSQFFLFHVSGKQLLCHLRRLFVFCESLSSKIFSMSCSVNEANLEVMFLLLHWRQATQSANLEILHRGHTWHTWHDYPWPWVSLTWLLYNLQLRFRPIRKEIVSWMYNNDSNLVQFRAIIIRNCLNWSGIIRWLARCFGNKSRFVWLHYW